MNFYNHHIGFMFVFLCVILVVMSSPAHSMLDIVVFKEIESEKWVVNLINNSTKKNSFVFIGTLSTQKFDHLKQWVVSKKGIVSPKVTLSESKHSGAGLYATADIAVC